MRQNSVVACSCLAVVLLLPAAGATLWAGDGDRAPHRLPEAGVNAGASLLRASSATHACCAGVQEEAPPEWRALFDGRSLAGWEETEFGGQGLVRVKDGALVLEFGEPLTGVTYTGDVPRVNYELRLDARRLSGTDFFCGLTFPVAASHASLILGGWGGALVGISNIDGQDASGNETTQYVRFEDERWYAVRVRVVPDRLQVWLDEKEIVDVAIARREIDVRPEMLLSRPLGIASYRTRAAIRRIEVRTLEP
jgi:hypothetical protein